MQATFNDEPSDGLNCDSLRQAAERIDPAAYHEVALALAAIDARLGEVKRLGQAILTARGEECQRHFLGEYADLAWESIRQELNLQGRRSW